MNAPTRQVENRDGGVSLTELEARLRAALQQAGQPYEGLLRYGEFIRYGDQGGKRPYWLIVQLVGGQLAAAFGDWRQGVKRRFKSWARDAALTAVEAAALQREWERRQREQRRETAVRQAQAARLANRLWAQLRPTGAHPYLERKQIPAVGVRFGLDERGRGPCVAVPLRRWNGALVSLQFIYPDGRKRFLPGGAKQGAFHVLGGITPGGRLYLAEGYATAASVYLATGESTAAAFDAGNLALAAAALRQGYPDLQLTLAADNDCWRAEELGPDGGAKGNPGVAKATAAARRYQARLAAPDFTGLDWRDRPTDFNDLARLAGLAAVRRQLEQADFPPSAWPDGGRVRDERSPYRRPAAPSKQSQLFGRPFSRRRPGRQFAHRGDLLLQLLVEQPRQFRRIPVVRGMQKDIRRFARLQPLRRPPYPRLQPGPVGLDLGVTDKAQQRPVGGSDRRRRQPRFFALRLARVRVGRAGAEQRAAVQ